MSDENIITASQMTVLCVDDDLNILKSMKRLFHKQDYRLLLAKSGVDALKLMQKHNVHLVISDMKMPAMSGVELLEKLAIAHPDTYRILLTGDPNLGSTIDAVSKIHRYIQKPWDNEDIIHVINECLEEVSLKQNN